MPWEARLRQAAYYPPESPNTAFTFQYENVSRETPKRSAEFEFASVDGAYVQDNGFGGRKFPLRCFFSGADHDLEATAFEGALLQRGVGRLSHPLYGEIDVVPSGTIARRDDLKSGANQSIVEVSFWETTKLVYPTNQLDARSLLESSIDLFNLTSGPAQFEDTVNVSSAISQANLKAKTQAALSAVEGALGPIAAQATDINNAYRDAQDAVALSMDVLVGQPLNLGQQLCSLLSLPARSTGSFADRAAGYESFAQTLFISPAGVPADAVGLDLPARATDIANGFYLTDLLAASAVNGVLLALLETTFSTRNEAQAAAETVTTLFDDFVVWREAGYAVLGIDSGESYQTLQQSVALAAGLAVEISFTLLAQRVLVLGRNRTLIDVASEVYGKVDDDTLNQLINQNALTGSQILELERGDSIVYYG